MPFRRILEELVERVPGARAAVLADWEGESVAAYTSGEGTDYDIKFIGAHHGIILEHARKVLTELKLGQTQELSFVQEKFHVLTAPVNSAYYVVLTLRPEAALARARFELRQALTRLKKEIE
jgi:predicted regulator of Ras-like GTPase activity (Roadblock/LC7/MglB family)